MVAVTESDVDRDRLRDDVDRIKRAMGLREEHPYWWRFWIVEGVGVGVLFPVLQVGIRDGFRPWVVALLVAVFLLHQVAMRRVLSGYERPTTGVPSWDTWHYVLFAGMAALIVGLAPVFDGLGDAAATRLALVSAGSVVGLGYLYMGQLLGSYDIRRADRYAFYAGGLWILALIAAIPHVPAVRGWEWAVLGLGVAAHNVGSYVVLSRV